MFVWLTYTYTCIFICVHINTWKYHQNMQQKLHANAFMMLQTERHTCVVLICFCCLSKCPQILDFKKKCIELQFWRFKSMVPACAQLWWGPHSIWSHNGGTMCRRDHREGQGARDLLEDNPFSWELIYSRRSSLVPFRVTSHDLVLHPFLKGSMTNNSHWGILELVGENINHI